MSEREVKFATRYIKRKRSNAVGRSLSKTLTEPITNSDDSYRRLLSLKGQAKHIFPINIFIDHKKRLVRIIDEAEGMTEKDLIEKFEEYGSDKSGASQGQNVRGLFGQGVSDVLFYHSQGIIKSIKNGKTAICRFYEKNDRPFINTNKIKGSISKISKEWGINSNHGTVVEFILDKDTSICDYDILIKRLSSFYMLRLIYADDTRKVKLVYVAPNGQKRESIIKYSFPRGNLVDSKEFSMSFEDYESIKINVELYKSKDLLQTMGDERENGLLVHDEKNTVYDLTFFGLDNFLGTDRFFGFMKLEGARKIILDKINNKEHPEEILTDTRDGFNRQHNFYKSLEIIIKDWLFPILNEEKKKKSEEGLSEATRDNHRKAFDELNKLHSELTGEYSSGTIRVPKIIKPTGGLEFSRKNISVTTNKKYGIQLLIDTGAIKPGSVIKIEALRKRIGFSPLEITVEGTKDNEGVLSRTITIVGTKKNTADTLQASYKRYNSSVVVSVVSEEIFYPENGLAFYPDYFRAITGRESSLHLYVDLRNIKIGSKISLISSNNLIQLRNKFIKVKKTLRNNSIITRLTIPFISNKNNESGTIEGSFLNYGAQARIDIKDRISREPTSLGGKFKDWAFDEVVPTPFQAIYDSNPQSPTCGFILINPNHPINQKYFGDKPKKVDIEQSQIAQHYLAELILNECLNVTIPEALQGGGLPRRLGDYDVLFYIAQKKFDYGFSIYKYFVNKISPHEIKREQRLQIITKQGSIGDNDLIKGMDDREKQMVEMHFGLNNERPHTLDEIARNFNITRERVRQIINAALFKKCGNYNFESEDNDIIKKYEEQMTTNVDNILKTISAFYEIKISELKSKSRKANIVNARQIAMYLLRKLMRLSFPSIGKIFNRDHTTAIYAFEQVMNTIEEDNSLKNQVSSIEKVFTSNIDSINK